MLYTKSNSTKVRFEEDGIYILDGEKQTKEKITDVQNEGYLFWKTINSKPVIQDGNIKRWKQKGFIIPVIDEDLYKKYKNEFVHNENQCTSVPVYVTLGVTSKCNFRCRHCGNFSGDMKDTDLTKDEILNIIKEFQDLQILKLNFTGGEPLIIPEIFEYMEFAKSKIPRITMTSNGSLIDAKVAKKLKQSGLDMMKLSIDGLKDFHDKHRNFEGAFELVIRAIKYLQQNDIEVRVQSTLMKDNQSDLLELMKLLSDLDISHQTVIPVCPIGRTNDSMMLSPVEYKQFIISMFNKVKQLNSKTHFQIRPIFGEQSIFTGTNNTSLETLSIKYSCEALKNTFEIQPNGNVVPCSFLNLSIGNIRKNNIINVWNSVKANEVRKLFDEDNLKGECKECENNKICKGGCIANKYFYSGTDKKDPYCFVS